MGRALPADQQAAYGGTAEVSAAATPEEKAQQDITQRVEMWRRRVNRAIEIRKDWAQHYDVEKGERYFLGEMEEKKLVLNHFAATIKTSRPNLFYTNPKFFVRPKPGRTEPVAERTTAIGEGVLEAIAQQDDHLEMAGELAVLQGYFRLGVLKVCYDPRMEPNPRAGEVIYQTVNGEPVTDPTTKEPVALKDPLTGKPVLEPDEVLTDEVYRWVWVDAANMLLPDEGPDSLKWTWLGEQVIVPLEDAKKDARFRQDLRTQLVANETTHRLRADQKVPAPRYEGGASAPGDELLKYYECYERRTKRWYVWADGQPFQDFLVDEAVPDWIDNDPYALLMLGEPILGPSPSPWPVPVVRDWLSPQNEYNIRRRQVMEGAKRSARKGIYDDNTFPDADEATKLLQNPDDMVFAKVNDVARPPVMLGVPDVNASIYRDIPMLQQDWFIITGQTGARLQNPEDTSATEASYVERAANLRDSDLQKKITRWMSSAGRKMFQCVKMTLTLDCWIKMREMDDKEFALYLERVYQVPLQAQAMMARAFPGLREAFRERFGQQKWLRVTREQLQFEADVTIAPGSTRPRNLDVERRNWLDFLRVIGQFPQLALSRELLSETAAKFETISERMLDELNALAQQMVQINAHQAGRDQGGNNGADTGGANTATALQGLMAALQANGGAKPAP